MPEKPFGAIEGDDPALAKLFIHYNHQPPDNFIESAEGGGINADELADESPTDEHRVGRGLEAQIRRLRPKLFEDEAEFQY